MRVSAIADCAARQGFLLQNLTMGIDLAVSLISAAVALGCALLTALLAPGPPAGSWSCRPKSIGSRRPAVKQEKRQDLMNRIRDPVLWSAFDLQSRIYNLVAQGFQEVYLLRGSAEQRAYAQRNTAFLFGQYLAWAEIVRRSVQFLDLGSKQENRELVDNFFKIGTILNSDGFPDSLFCIFRGDQRAIGEIMIDNSADGELACIGYAEFCSRMDADPPFSAWLGSLSLHIEQLPVAEHPHPRLVAIQNNLVDLINLLDPESIRFPEWHRSKLEWDNLV